MTINLVVIKTVLNANGDRNPSDFEALDKMTCERSKGRKKKILLALHTQVGQAIRIKNMDLILEMNGLPVNWTCTVALNPTLNMRATEKMPTRGLCR